MTRHRRHLYTQQFPHAAEHFARCFEALRKLGYGSSTAGEESPVVPLEADGDDSCEAQAALEEIRASARATATPKETATRPGP